MASFFPSLSATKFAEYFRESRPIWVIKWVRCNVCVCVVRKGIIYDERKMRRNVARPPPKYTIENTHTRNFNTVFTLHHNFAYFFNVLVKFHRPGRIPSFRASRQYLFCPTKVNILAAMTVELQLSIFYWFYCVNYKNIYSKLRINF